MVYVPEVVDDVDMLLPLTLITVVALLSLNRSISPTLNLPELSENTPFVTIDEIG